MSIINYEKECPYYEVRCDMNTCPCAKYKAYLEVKENKIGDLEYIFNNLPSDKFSSMMLLQKEFGKKFCSFGNLSDEQKHIWVMKFIDCVTNEVDEFRDQFPWEDDVDYSNFKFNLKEAKKEVIDIWHFVMSAALAKDLDFEQVTYIVMKEMGIRINEEQFKDFDNLDLMFEFARKEYADKCDKMNDYDLVQKMLKFTAYVSSSCEKLRNQLNWKHWKTYTTFELNEKVDKFIARMFIHTIYLGLLVDMYNSEEVYKIYVDKNKENHLRQKNNY